MRNIHKFSKEEIEEFIKSKPINNPITYFLLKIISETQGNAISLTKDLDQYELVNEAEIDGDTLKGEVYRFKSKNGYESFDEYLSKFKIVDDRSIFDEDVE